MSIPAQPPNEGSTQFVYQFNDGNFYLVDYTANTVSMWNPLSGNYINKGGNLQTFVAQLQQQEYQAWVASLVANNQQPATTDYFGNTDTVASVNSGAPILTASPGQITM